MERRGIDSNSTTKRLGIDDLKSWLSGKRGRIESIAFHRFLQKEIAKRDISGAEILKKSNLNKNTYYAILRGERKPSRNKVIQLAFGLGFNPEETDDLLWRAGYAYLDNVNSFRDTIIRTCLENNHNIDVTESLLQEFEEELFVND
ncbi:helix-turn-helix domain-containing protein [Paenibacillus sp. UNC451MF]|uniref:helix-turn-helix domain-containing protein n=1 Tax=Paenibacillus sp. UNC451MF TaxID=1449063 RepID=UPI00048F4E4B|nr:helix-turn-helix transcriptional regulator [Paenibacillus sp. UNC451MF]